MGQICNSLIPVPKVVSYAPIKAKVDGDFTVAVWMSFTIIYPYIRILPLLVRVTTRIITFQVGDAELNLHLALLLGGQASQPYIKHPVHIDPIPSSLRRNDFMFCHPNKYRSQIGSCSLNFWVGVQNSQRKT